jgi:hypothetical protein
LGEAWLAATSEQATAQKRADDFACGSLVVWDVDLLSDEAVKGSVPMIPTTRRAIGVGILPRRNRHTGEADTWRGSYESLLASAKIMTTGLMSRISRLIARRFCPRLPFILTRC